MARHTEREIRSDETSTDRDREQPDTAEQQGPTTEKKRATAKAGDAAVRRMAEAGPRFTRPWERHPLVLERARERSRAGESLTTEEREILASYYEDHPEKRPAASVEDGEPEVVADLAPSDLKAKRDAIEDWFNHSSDNIHRGLEKALVSKIVGDVDAKGADAKAQIVDKVEEHFRDRLGEFGKEALTKRAQLSTKGAGKAMRNAAKGLKSGGGAGEAAELTPVVGQALAVVGAAKDVSDKVHAAEVAVATAGTLKGLVEGLQTNTETYIEDLRARARSLSDEEIASIDPACYATPMISTDALAFWFERIVAESMRECGVMHHDEMAEDIQSTLHPGAVGDGGEK